MDKKNQRKLKIPQFKSNSEENKFGNQWENVKHTSDVGKEECVDKSDESSLNYNNIQRNNHDSSINTLDFGVHDSGIFNDSSEDTQIISTYYTQMTNLKNNSYNTFNGDCSSDDDNLEYLDNSNLNLNYHQKEVIEWMITCESREPYGGIIATDMGSVDYKMSIIMGLLLKSNVPYMNNTKSEGETDLDETVHEVGHTLLICSNKSEIDKWIECVQKKISPNTLNVCFHYGRNREMSLESLTQKDIVITTVKLAQTGFRQKENNPLYQIKWDRIILDDALCARNYKRQISKALCQLSGICHWAFAGSNFIDYDEEATYSLIKYINYKPFNNIEKWNKWLKTNQTILVKEKLYHIIYSNRIV